MSIESMMPYNHLILCHPLLLLVFSSIRVFSKELALCIRRSKRRRFFYNPMNVDNLFSSSSVFSKSSLYIWNFSVHLLLKTSLKDFEHGLTSMWNESTCMVVWMSFGIALLWDWNEDQSFSVPWPLLSFQTLLTYECSTLTASYFRILSSSAGILSPALALFIVMLPKVHLTSHISLCILCIKKQSILFYTLK